MSVFIGATVVHRAAINRRRGYGLTACGIQFVLTDSRFREQGAFDDEDFCQWLSEQRGDYIGSCFHCSNREPAWQRLRRRRQRLQRALLKMKQRRSQP